MSAPRIWPEHPDLDPLEPLPGVQREAGKLRPGMVVLDPDLKTPGVSIDHRTRAPRGSGLVAYLVWDYDTRTWTTQTLSPRTLVWVACTADPREGTRPGPTPPT